MVKYLVLLFAVYAVFLEERLLSVANNDYKVCCKCHTSQFYQYRSGKCESFTCSSSCANDADCRLSGECCVLGTDAFKGCRQCRYNPDCGYGKKCCYRFSAKQTRCRDNCLGLYCDSTRSCRGTQECCRNNVCVNCSKPGCRNNDECGSGQSCCNKKEIQGDSFCRSSCIGARCEADTDCASRECCHDEKCVKCSSLQCSSNSVCGSAYCCKRRYYYDKSRCMTAGCIGQTCAQSSDCGGLNECCRDNICAYCSESRCKDNSECPLGEYCCKRNGQAMCRQTCEGQFCNAAEDCGAPEECCIANKCTTSGCHCNSNFDCKFGEYCCKYSDNACNSSCIGKGCLWDTDCGAPGEECTYPDSDCFYSRYDKKCPKLPEKKCFNKNGCYSHDDCNVFGSGYYCCKGQFSSDERSCNSNCLKKFCNENSDCGGSSECCESNNQCYKCPNNVPAWVIGITVGIALLVITAVGVVLRYIHSKRKQERIESQPSQTGVIEMEFQQNNSHQNIYSAGLQSTVGTWFVDDVQPSQPTQPWTGISPSQTVLQQMPVMPFQNLGINNLGNVESNTSLAGNRNDDNETVVPSAPPPPYPVTPPPHPPPSYQNLYGNR